MHSVLFASGSGEWETPKELFSILDGEFHFTLDAAATKANALCKKFFTKEDDALRKSWENNIVFLNPPYGRGIDAWVDKAYRESVAGATVVALLPVRTDTKWWWENIQGKAEVRFIRGRLTFGLPGKAMKNVAPFPSCVVIFRARAIPWENGLKGVKYVPTPKKKVLKTFKQTKLFKED